MHINFSKTKGLFLLFALLCSTLVNAASTIYTSDFYMNGLYYKITNSTSKYVQVCNEKVVKDDGDIECTTNYSGSITIPSTVKYNNITYTVTGIYQYAFYNSNVTIINLPSSSSFTEINQMAFEGCSYLTTVSFGSNYVSYIGKYAFEGCQKLSSFSMPAKVKTINEGVFEGCSSLSTINISNITSLSASAFYRSGLKSVTVPEGVTAIPDYAFCECNQLENITIPSTVKSLGQYALTSTKLCQVVVRSKTPPTTSSLATFGVSGPPSTCILYVPAGTRRAYDSTSSSNRWQEFKTILSETTEVAVSSVSISPSSLTLAKGKSALLTAVITPSDASDKEVTWSSSNTSIASVSANGYVTAGQTFGSATITCTSLDNTSKTATCTVNVVDDRYQVVSSNTAAATVTFADSGSYGWVWDSTKSKLRSSNYNIDSSTSAIDITIKTDVATDISFDYAVSSESGYDKYTITLDGTTIANAISGTVNNSYQTTISAGTYKLSLSYKKDGSTSSNDDYAYLYNLKIDKSTHTYSNGFCTDCGKYEIPQLVNNYYQIDNAGKLYWFAQKVNSGTGSINGKLTADITDNTTVLADVLVGDNVQVVNDKRVWLGIGDGSHPYSGTFDGSGYYISGLYNYYGVGSLFGCIVNATVKGVTVKDCLFTSAGICSNAQSSTIQECNSYARVFGDGTAAGIVASCDDSSVGGCINYGKITSKNTVGGIVGGAVGANSWIKDCTNKGYVGHRSSTASGVYSGGICGDVREKQTNPITGCSNFGQIYGDGTSSKVGGIVGSNYGTSITNCGNYAKVSNTSSSSSTVGGICGQTESGGTTYDVEISYCLNNGTAASVAAIVGYAGDMPKVEKNWYLTGTSVCSSGTYTGSNYSYASSDLISGKVAWWLDWYQNLDNGQTVDSYPVLDNTHGIVYCLSAYNFYTNSPIVDATSITANVPSETAIGQPYTVSATASPANATINSESFKAKYNILQWTSSNPTVASINSTTGVVTINSKGSTTITAKLTDGSNLSSSKSLRVYLLGDANGSDAVNIADISTIAAKKNGLTPTNYHFAPANANFTDNVINVADITTTLGIVWNGVSHNAKRNAPAVDVLPTSLSAQTALITPNGETNLYILVDNPSDEVTAFEFVMKLPYGIKPKRDENGNVLGSISTERTDASRTDYFSIKENEDGDWYVLCYSSQLEPFAGNTGAVAVIPIVAEDISEGVYDVEFEDAVLSGYGNVIKPEIQSSTINVVTPTGIEAYNPSDEGKYWIYDISGRLIMKNGQPTKYLNGLPSGVYIVNGQKVCK